MATGYIGQKSTKENEDMKQEALGAVSINVSLRCLTRKERYEYMLKEIKEVKHALSTANSQKSVENVLDALSAKIFILLCDKQVLEVKKFFADINGTINEVKMHDATRSDIDKMLQVLCENIESIIAEEKEKENMQKFKKLCEELAAHADEVSKVIDLNKIFG